MVAIYTWSNPEIRMKGQHNDCQHYSVMKMRFFVSHVSSYHVTHAGNLVEVNTRTYSRPTQTHSVLLLAWIYQLK